MSILNIPVAGTTFQTEVSITNVNVSASAVSISGQTITVTSTSHGFTVGQYFTFSGVTGATGLNSQTWQVATVADANTLTATIATGSSVSGTPGGTIYLQRVFNPGPGSFFVTTGANCVVEYSPNNALIGTPGQTWRTLVAASSQGYAYIDGVGTMRIRVSTGTAGTTYYSQVA